MCLELSLFKSVSSLGELCHSLVLLYTDMLEKTILPEEQQKIDKEIVRKIFQSDIFAYNFLCHECRPLISRILYDMFDDDTEYEDLLHDLYIYLCRPGEDGHKWHSFVIFDYRTSLFDYIKNIAIHLFLPKDNTTFGVPDYMLQNGKAEELFTLLGNTHHSQYLIHYYIKAMRGEKLAKSLGVEANHLQAVFRGAKKSFAKLLKNDYPQYYNIFYTEHYTGRISIDSPIYPVTSIEKGDETEQLERVMDVEYYLARMPNKRYSYILKAYYIYGMSISDIANKWNMTCANVSNIKLRAIDQLRYVILDLGEVKGVEPYINKIDVDICRKIIDSLYIEKKSDEQIYTALGLTHSEYIRKKSIAIKKLQYLMFPKKEKSKIEEDI